MIPYLYIYIDIKTYVLILKPISMAKHCLVLPSHCFKVYHYLEIKLFHDQSHHYEDVELDYRRLHKDII
jgi:hypothetical protein